MMGFAKIAGGAPSAVRAMANHLMNATLRPEESRLAAYYSLGMAQPDQEAPLTKRELRNAQHVGDWLAGKVKPDLVRLAEYAMTQGVFGNCCLPQFTTPYPVGSDGNPVCSPI
jgi:hypothetical protein